MYLGPDERPLPRHRCPAPARAGVPGTFRGLGLAHQNYGKAAWADLVRPSARLAREGFAVSETLARSLNAQLFARPSRPGEVVDLGTEAERLADFPESVSAFRNPDGTPWRAGDVPPPARPRRHPRSHRRAGRRRVLHGADRPDHRPPHGPGHDGLITSEDLASYRARVRPPVHTTFPGFRRLRHGPRAASGGIVLAQMLNILERYDLPGRRPPARRAPCIA